MANIVQLEVLFSKLTKNNSYYNKLRGQEPREVKTGFGTSSQSSQVTYYLFTEEPNKIGHKAKLDLSLFDIEHKPHQETEVDEETGEIKVIDMVLKTLHPKR